MWLQAQEEVKKLISALEAKLIGNVALVDEASTAGSFIATPLWVLTGNKGPRLNGLIPRAGVSPEEVKRSERFGLRLREALEESHELNEAILSGLSAVDVNEHLIASEKIGRRSFLIWGGLLRKIGRQGAMLRKPVLAIYIIFLLTLILTVVPLSALIKKLLSPLFKTRIAQQKHYFALPSGE